MGKTYEADEPFMLVCYIVWNVFYSKVSVCQRISCTSIRIVRQVGLGSGRIRA